MKATEGADGTVFYIDRDSIKKEGALIRVWELQDLKAKGPLEEKSRRVLVEYDSKNEKRRVLSFSFHGESMGAGVTLKSDQTPGKWTMVVPNTTAAVVFQVASALKRPVGKTSALPPPPPPPPTPSDGSTQPISEGDKELNASSSESPGEDKSNESAASSENPAQPETNNK
ncbi:MAG: surface-adhesin E family protein [Burkholderiaceae bacterium]